MTNNNDIELSPERERSQGGKFVAKTAGRKETGPENRARPSTNFDPAAYGLRADVTRGAVDSAAEGRFNVPREAIPEGWVVEWKQPMIYGQPCSSEEIIMDKLAGWQNYPPKLFPDLCPAGWTKDYVERGGQILMMRPKQLQDEARAEERKKAVLAKLNQEAAIGKADPEECARIAGMSFVRNGVGRLQSEPQAGMEVPN